MLEIRGLSKTFGPGTRGSGKRAGVDGDDRPAEDSTQTHALAGIDLSVDAGEFVTVLGPSGCGKTTLLRTIAGFETPDTGSIRVADRLVYGPGVRTIPAHERGIGLVPQEGALFPHLTVAQNVAFGLSGMRRGERRARVEQALEMVGLERLGTRRPHELSGGQQQRIALARAIAPGPSVILFDEPFSALDEYLRDSLRTQVRELLTSLHATAILVTHDQEEALALGDRVVVMRHGQVVQAGTPRETYYQPVDLELARFLGEVVVVDGMLDAAAPRVSCAFGMLPVSCPNGATGRCEVMIRPENIRVKALASAAGSSSDGGPVGTVLDQTFYGHDGILRVDVPELSGQISVRVMGDQPIGVGDRVRLAVDTAVCTYPS